MDIPYNALTFPSKGAWRDEQNRSWVFQRHKGRRFFSFYYKCLHRAPDPRFGERVVLHKKNVSTKLEFTIRRVFVNHPCSETRRIEGGGPETRGSTVVGGCDAIMTRRTDSELGYLNTLTSRYPRSREAGETIQEEEIVEFAEREEGAEQTDVTRTQPPRPLVPPSIEPPPKKVRTSAPVSSLGKIEEGEEEEEEL